MGSENFSDRVKEVLGERSARSFARSVGLSEGAIRALLSGGRPTLDTLLAIVGGTGVELKWLATGEGPKFASGAEPASDDTVRIPYLDVRAAAGSGATGDSGEAIGTFAFPSSFLRSMGVNPANLRVLTARGDSMLPTISDGDPLVVDVSASRIGGAAIYVLVRDGEVIVKRAERRLNGSILVTSDNDRYPPEEINDASGIALNVAGRVIWHGRLV